MGSVRSSEFRKTMSQFCTGVVAVTGCYEEKPIGFAAQSFASVSLEPFLVALCPSKSSTSWPKIREAGRFCVNILAKEQLPICEAMSRSGGDKFIGLEWRGGLTGSPIFSSSLGYAECEIEAEHEAGDHLVVIGRVIDFDLIYEKSEPLLFFRSEYGSFV